MLRLSSTVVVLGLMAPLASARMGVVPRPTLGDWEGVGPHGLPLSFVLTKPHRKIVLSKLVVGLPLNCPAKPTPWVVSAYPTASYGGPGAQPRVRLPGWKPTDVEISAFNRGEFPLLLGGRLLTRRHMTLSSGIGPRVPKHCGWPKKTIVWSVRPAKREAVQPGSWTGAATLSDGTGTITTKVIAAGRVVDLFRAELTCATGGGDSFQSGPPAGEFVSASGMFEGWAYSNHWQARFGANGSLTGTLDVADPCGSGGQVSGSFIAQRSGP